MLEKKKILSLTLRTKFLIFQPHTISMSLLILRNYLIFYTDE